jgi:hypothetical protein
MTEITSTGPHHIRDVGEVRSTRTLAALASLAALAGVAALTLAPQSIVGPARGAFMRAMDGFAPLIGAIGYGDAEQVLNTVLFLPLGAALALLLSRRAWPWAIVAGLALSASVEFLQASIPGRVPDPADIFWNTAGAAIGVVVVTVPRFVAAALARGQRGRTTRT